LEAGVDYHFSVIGINFNGEGALSEEFKLWACQPPA
jgi:hypothetical protein